MDGDGFIQIGYTVAAIFGVTAFVAWSRELRRKSDREEKGLPARSPDLEHFHTAAAMALGIAGATYLLSLL